ncbi:hypothetical protein RFM41_08790 [Mesorhizobium sp. VK25A]|uniref:Antifreeze protein n=1 Tax=Mesorhizobium vachelliae TaxID=3072309 RepID=A0ABU5A229_9HYPH|nr:MULTISPECIES: hypothetical protein [unclassified Mesorhizobium]MDX8531724.1 hypothetical protein [Mesorhizobium sp. VK25D]MDX8543833.1 hypothetical protein [Mesorhizobium sp. VK25A]
MRVPLSIAAIAVILAFSPNAVMAATKTVKECDAEYAANKDAIKGSGQTKKDFVASCRAGSEVVPAGAAAAPAAVTPAKSTAAGNVKTAKECDAEYAANKDAIKGSGQTKKDFVASCRSGSEVIPGGAAAAAPATVAPTAAAPAGAGGVKTAKECDTEYSANKAAIKGSGQTKKDFVASCRAGTETIPGAQSTTAAPQPAKPAPTVTTTPSKNVQAKTVPAPSATTVPTGANQFATEAQAKARCPSSTVVWVNLKSKIFHFAGNRNYGTTKSGAYICETDATAEGFRAAENEKQPQ